MNYAIRPEDISEQKKLIFPKEVFDSFNALIAKNYSGGSAKVMQTDVAHEIASRLDISKEEVFKRNYLDVEDCYRESGWKVEYDKPAYCETYPAFFRFSKK